jgi:hypothetical protein
MYRAVKLSGESCRNCTCQKTGSRSSRESPTVHVAVMTVVSGVFMVNTQELIAAPHISVTKTVTLLVCLQSQLRISRTSNFMLALFEQTVTLRPSGVARCSDGIGEQSQCPPLIEITN